MDTALSAVGEKIKSRLLATEKAPEGAIALSFQVFDHLTGEELNTLNALEKEQGEEKANQWHVGTMVGTGKYIDNGDGTVAVKKEAGDMIRNRPIKLD